jgi:hypothetical protein
VRPTFGLACASVASIFAVVKMLRFGFGAPMSTSALVMFVALTVIFLVASAFLHHPTYDDAGPAAAVTLSTGIVIGLLTFFFVLRWREHPTLPAYIALGVYTFGFTTVGVLLFLGPSSSRTVEEVVALRRKAEVRGSAPEERTGGRPVH